MVIMALAMCSCGKSTPEQMPDIDLADTDGNLFSARSLCNGDGPLMVTFFATWCDPCCQELNVIKELYPEMQKRFGAEFVVVSIDKYPTQIPVVTNMMKQHGWDCFRLLFDSDSKLVKQLDVQTIPSTLYIMPDGRIFDITVGFDGTAPRSRIFGILEQMTSQKK